ncbi:MAG: carboxypeptidase-like regulatory domain-containing protein [Muribaculaceae bacterium]|nr:carboxypeptidase-like regulatory domain-containing protein [Muribaculaceae bacterium]
MNKIVIFGAIALLGLIGTACHSDDPTPGPEVEVPAQPNVITGIVTDRSGNPISGATVAAGNLSAQTGSDGVYTISGVQQGTIELTASASGKLSTTGSVTVAAGGNQSLIWNAMLATDNTRTLIVDNEAGGAEGTVTSDAVEGNTKGEIDITVDVPENTLSDDTRITITPIYTEDSELVGRATSETMLIGAVLSSSNTSVTTLPNDINVSFAVDNTVTDYVVTKQLINGTWQVVDNDKTDTGITVKTRHFGAIGLFFNVTITETSSSEALTMNPNEWDNTAGTQVIRAGKSTFTYKMGSEYNAVGANSLEALLIERLADIVGPRTVKTINGEYPIDQNISIGTGLKISGTQAVKTVSVTSRNRSAQATSYGTVTIRTASYTRGHNGGSN